MFSLDCIWDYFLVNLNFLLKEIVHFFNQYNEKFKIQKIKYNGFFFSTTNKISDNAIFKTYNP